MMEMSMLELWSYPSEIIHVLSNFQQESACAHPSESATLAIRLQDQHLKVLVQNREHILHVHPPANAFKLMLWEHFHDLDLWNIQESQCSRYTASNFTKFGQFQHCSL
jgi:hypothetical protein